MASLLIPLDIYGFIVYSYFMGNSVFIGLLRTLAGYYTHSGTKRIMAALGDYWHGSCIRGFFARLVRREPYWTDSAVYRAASAVLSPADRAFGRLHDHLSESLGTSIFAAFIRDVSAELRSRWGLLSAFAAGGFTAGYAAVTALKGTWHAKTGINVLCLLLATFLLPYVGGKIGKWTEGSLIVKLYKDFTE